MKLTPVLSCLIIGVAAAKNYDVGRTPPMGWLSWERYRCQTDCATYPDSCINEQLYMAMADHMVSDGFRDAGYVYVNIDDCWAAKQRNADNRLVADPDRFPSGIKALADYMHTRGLKLGIYGDIGTETCGGYPGSQGFYDIDANTYAEWGVDSLKEDGCYAKPQDYAISYPNLSRALDSSGRDILYACSWPAYIVGHANFTEISQYCNYWRAYDDIQDSAESLYGIINWWSSEPQQSLMVAAAGPSSWNDPDMLIIGDFSLSEDQEKIQFALWAIFAAPLYMSNDLRDINAASKAILLNTEIIAVNQDKAGMQGKKVLTQSQTSWYVRPLADGSHALAIVRTGSAGSATYVETSFASIGLSKASYTLRDLYEGKDVGKFTGSFKYLINPLGVAMFKVTAV